MVFKVDKQNKQSYHLLLPYMVSADPKATLNTLINILVKKEPKIALLGGENGTDLIAKLIRQSPKHLKKNGKLILEISPSQKNIVFSLNKISKWSSVERHAL